MKTYLITFSGEIEVADNIDEQEAIEAYLIDIENNAQYNLISYIVSKLEARLIHVSSPLKIK